MNTQIKTIHLRNCRKMKSLTNTEFKYEWEDSNIKKLSIGEVRRINIPLSHSKEEIKEIEDSINQIIFKFNKREINFNEFCVTIDKKLDKVGEIDNEIVLVGNFKYYLRSFINKYRTLLISGVGGIGKSHFLYEVTKKISEREIDSVFTVYSKFTKNIKEIPWEIVYAICNEKEFTVIIDAINELDSDNQQFCLDISKQINKTKYGRIIMSYRTNCIDKDLEAKLKDKLRNHHLFQGVSYESSIIPLVERFGRDFHIYEGVIDTNNPLLLNMLHQSLDKVYFRQTRKKSGLNSIASITHIYENFIQEKTTKKHWEITKLVTKYMYEENLSYIYIEDLKRIAGDDLEQYLTKMLEEGLLSSLLYEDEKAFLFTHERLNDYLIARNLFQDMRDKNNKQIINFLEQKVSKNKFSVNQAFILVLFDRFKNDINSAIKIILETKLKDVFDAELIKLIVFADNEKIQEFQSNVQPNCDKEFLRVIGGVFNKPFNFTNYFNQYLFKNSSFISKLDYDFFIFGGVESRLYNSLKSVNYSDVEEGYLKEKFWFGFWFMSSSVKNVRVIATKLVFDIVSKKDEYIECLIDSYFKVEDDYIQRGIISVLSSLSEKYKSVVKDFLISIYNDKEELNAKKLYHISRYLYNDGHYINLNKRNLYKNISISNPQIERHILKLLYDIEFDKNYLINLDYHNYSQIVINQDFIKTDKNILQKYTEAIDKYFNCIFDGECQSLFYREKLYKDIMTNFNKNEKLESKKLYLIWQQLFLEYANKYELKQPYEYKSYDWHERSKNDILWKCIELATDDFFGTLMCNYYVENTFSDTQNYLPYNPNEYHIYTNLNTPVTIHSEIVEKLDSKIIYRLTKTIPKNQDLKWYNNLSLSISNIKSLIKPVELSDSEWILIHGRIYIFEKDQHGRKYSDDYILNISINDQYKLSGIPRKDSKYTIERNRFYDNITDFQHSNNTSCVLLPSITDQTSLIKPSKIALPPSEIIKYLGLEYDNKLSSWVDSDKNPVIICNNNVKKWYQDQMLSSVYVRKSVFGDITRKHDVKFWGFAERLLKNMGYSDESSIQIEFTESETLDWYQHYKSDKQIDDSTIDCSKCYIYFENRKEQERLQKEAIEAFINIRDNLS